MIIITVPAKVNKIDTICLEDIQDEGIYSNIADEGVYLINLVEYSDQCILIDSGNNIIRAYDDNQVNDYLIENSLPDVWIKTNLTCNITLS